MVISYLSNTPSSGIPTVKFLQFAHIDKLVHFVFYFVLVLLCSYGFRKQHSPAFLRKHFLITSLVFAVIWGGLMELMQLTVFTYRFADWRDMLANTFGALTGVWTFNQFFLRDEKI